jgi:VCBS repeat-containing protein
MPTIIQTINGKVTGLWGSALRRTLAGKLIALKMGDLVTKGDIILTTQNGIVELSPDPDAPPTVAATPSTDIDRVIADLNQPDALNAPAAGLTGGDGSGLQLGLRVGRISEDITPAPFAQADGNPAQRFFEDRTNALEDGQATQAPANVNPNATPATTSGNEDATLPLSLAGQDSDGAVASITVISIPAGSTLLLADGVTPVVAGQTLTPAQAATLLFSPALDFTGGTAVTFTVTDNEGSVSPAATVQINVLSVNDAPVASAEVAATAEDTLLAGNLLTNDRDVDGPALSVTQFTVNGATVPAGTPTALPGVGTLLINTDGSYTFTPATNYNGPVPVATYTVSDGSLATTSTLSISVGAVNDAPVANDDVASTAINAPVTIAVLANDTDPDGDALTVSNPVLADSAQGTVTIDASGQLVFTPASNLTGPVSISYTVTDPSGATHTASVLVNVGNNTPPDGTDGTLTFSEDSSHALQAADFGYADADLGQSFANVRIDTLPAGSLLLNGNPVGVGQLISVSEVNAGQLVFTPTANANGAPLTSFSFSVQDSAGAFDTAPNTLAFNVTPVNDAPAANPDTVPAVEDTPVTFDPRTNDSDIDGPALTIVSVGGQPIAVGTPVVLPQGTVSLNLDGTLTFNPALHFNGPVRIPYTVTDGSTPASSTVTINVAPVNDAPVAGDDIVSTAINTAVTIPVLSNDSDVEGDTLTVSNPVLANPALGTVSVDANGQLVFVPASNVTGAVSISYTVTDPSGATDNATVTVNVGANTPPTGADAVRTIGEDTSYNLQPSDFGFADTDAAQSFAGVRIDTPPAAGSLLLNGVPVTAGTVVSAADIAAGSLVFTPAANGNGSPYASIGFSVQDSAGAFDAAPNSFTLNVTPVNDAPIANDDLDSTAINNAVLINVKSNDTDTDDTPSQLSVSNPVIDPSKGTVTVDASGQLLFTPATNVSGPVTITYTLTDLAGLSDTANVTVNVGSNTPPVGADAARTVVEDTGYTLATADFGFVEADAGQTFAAVRIDSVPANGELRLNGNAVAAGTVVSAADVAASQLQFVPPANANGAPYGSFTFSVQDSAGAFDAVPNTFTLNVTPVNDAPVANADTVAATEDTPVTFDPRGNDTDVDGPALAITQVAGQPIAVSTPVTLPQGTVSLNADGTLTFTPAQDFNGAVSIPYTVSDGNTPASSTITVNVAPAPDAPVITGALTGSVSEDGTLTSSDSLTIADPDAGESSFVAQPGTAGTYGSFTLSSTGTWVYTLNNAAPNVQALAGGANATESFIITTADGSTRSVVVTVNGTNDVPVAVADTGTATEDLPLTGNVLGNDSDVDTGSSLAVTQFVVSGTTYLAGDTAVLPQGSLSIAADGSYTFTPAANYNSAVNGAVPVASYSVSDGTATTTSTLTLTVTAVNDAPVGVDDSATLAEDSTRVGNVIGNGIASGSDTDADGDTLTVTQFVIGGNTYAAGLTATLAQGSLRIEANGDYSFTPAANYNGTVPVATYTLTDGSATSTATLTLAVTPENDAPTVGDDVASTAINTPVTIMVIGNDSDIDGDTLTVSNPVLADPAQGTVSVDVNGQIVFTPTNNISGPVQITYTLTDPSGASNTANVLVNVGTNTAPTGTDATRSFAEDTSYTVQSGDFGFADADANQTLINVRIDAPPAVGTLLLNGIAVTAGQVVAVADVAAGNLVFEPVANGNGAPYASFSFSVQDSAGSFATVPNTVTLNVTSVADAAVITAGSGTVTEDVAVNAVGQLIAGGQLAITDPDAGEAAFQPQASAAGIYGSFTFAADGTWSYAASNNNPAIQSLAAGQTVTDTLTVQSVDGTASTITITLVGTNDGAVITPAIVSLSETDSVLTTGGQIAISDIDSVATFVAQTNVAGSSGYGHFNLAANGTWSYATDTEHNEFAAGISYTDTLTVTSADGTTSTITVNILGTNDAAVITPATVNLTETNAVLTTGGTLAITDVDSPLTFVAQNNVAGSAGYGHFTLGTNGAWTYTADTAHNEFVDGTTYTDTLTVTSADGTTSTITVNILGTNDAAVITPATVNLTETNAVLTTGGTLAITDVDSPLTFVAQNNVAGSAGYGHFTLGTNGAWTYAADTTHNEFVDGTTYIDTLTVTSADGTTSTITVNILGTNDAAVITPAVVNLTETNAVLTTGGTLAISDVDSAATFVAQPNVAGSNGYGQFTLATNGTWTYTANTAHNEFVDGTTYTDTLTVTSADGTTSTITVNILGTNDAAVITPAVVNLTETNAVLTTGGTLAISDVDSSATFVAQSNVAGSNGYGQFTLATNGTWTYTANTAHNEFVDGTTYTDTLTVTSADGTTSTITVNILGTNDAAVITPAVVNLTESDAVLTTGGTLAISDVDSAATFIAQSNVAGSNGYGSFTLATNGTWTYTANTARNEFVADTTYTDTLTVTSADGTTSTITVNILGTNDAAVITPATVNLTETNAVLTTGGTLTVTDVDSAATFVAQSNVAGSNGYGTFTLATNGAWTYTANTAHNEFVDGTTYTDTLTVTSADGTTSTITVNILGTNDAAVITPAVVNLTESESDAVLTTGGTLAISDVDSATTFVAQSNVAGSNGYGQFTLATNGTWTYTANTAHNEFVAGTTYTDTLTVTSADGTPARSPSTSSVSTTPRSPPYLARRALLRTRRVFSPAPMATPSPSPISTAVP